MAQADEIIRKIRAEAVRQGLRDPDLAVAVAMKESALKPEAWGDRGASLGLFQLQRAAAIDAGIDPARRQEVDLNIRGGVTYLKQKLDQSGGNVEEALRRYNSGTPTFRGLGDPRYVERAMQIRRDLEQPATWRKFGAVETSPGAAPSRGSLLSRIGRAVSPASAEAAEPSAAPGALSPADRAALEARRRQLLEQRRQWLLEERARLTGTPSYAAPPAREPPPSQAPPQAPPEEIFPPLAEQEAASRHKALYGTLPQGYDPTRGQAPSPPPAAPAAAPAPAPAPATAPAPGKRLEEVITGQPLAPPPAKAPGTILDEELARLKQEEHARLTGTGMGKTAAATAVSTALSAGGAAAGTYVLPGYGTIVGEMAGSYLARKINVALGLEQKGFKGDVAALALPPIGRAVVPAVKWGVRHLPGAQAALHADVAGRLAGQAEGLRPATPSQALYNQVAQGTNPQVATRHLWRTAHEILRDEMRLQPAMRNNELVRVAQDVFDMAQPGLGRVQLADLYANQQRVGEMIRAARRAGGSEESGLRRLYGACHADLEAAAAQGIPEADTLRAAIASSRREHAVDELEELFRPGRPGIVQRADGQISISGGRLQTRFEDRLRNDQVFRESFQPEERTEIRQLLREATRLKPLPAPRGVAIGSGLAVARGGLAAGVTQALTGDPALASIMGGIAAGGPQLLSWGLSSAPGRAIVRQALREGRQLSDPVTLMSLFLAARPAIVQAGKDVAGAMAPGE